MKPQSTVLVLVIAYASINIGIALDLSPINLSPRKDADSCACIPRELCNGNNREIVGKPCENNYCGFVSMRINDGTCASHLVQCCKESISSPTETVSKAPACPCVPSSMCDKKSEPPCTDGCGRVDERFNDDSCPPSMVRCCNVITTAVKPSVFPDVAFVQVGNQSCPCLDYYLCDRITKTPCTDGCGEVDERYNEGDCPPAKVPCCLGVNNTMKPESASTYIPSVASNVPDIYTKLNENQTCRCLDYLLCDKVTKTPCTDGCGEVDERYNDGNCPPGQVPCCSNASMKPDSSTYNPYVVSKVPDLSPVLNQPVNLTCPCLDYFLCDKVTKTPCTDGCGIVDERYSDGTCPSGKIQCCNVPSLVTMTTSIIQTNETCPCIDHYLCDRKTGHPCTDGCGIVDERYNEDQCQPPMIRCCKKLTTNTMTRQPFEPPNPPNVDNTPVIIITNQSCPCIPHNMCDRETGIPCTDGCGIVDERYNELTCPSGTIRCCKGIKSPTTDEFIPSTGSKCGRRNPSGIGFREIESKKFSNFGEFPWMVAILYEDFEESENPDILGNNLLRYQCGGSLIHPEVVLTSTHCVISNEKIYQIRAGEWDINSKQEVFPYQDRSVVKVITHPEYYSGGAFNDIALLILNTPINMTYRNVDTVCLPPANIILDNISCYTSGWGKNVFEREGEYQSILKKVYLPIVQRDICQEQLKIARSRNDFELHKSFICAGGKKGKDSCVGDGGSPLVCPFSQEPKRYYQAGIVSWGIGCGQENVPGLYANVALFRNWVDEHMVKLGYDTSYYTY